MREEKFHRIFYAHVHSPSVDRFLANSDESNLSEDDQNFGLKHSPLTGDEVEKSFFLSIVVSRISIILEWKIIIFE